MWYLEQTQYYSLLLIAHTQHKITGIKMAYYAKIENNIVTEVMSVTTEQFNAYKLKTVDELWVQTNYNTEGGIYYIPNVYPKVPDPDQSKALRANYAGIGYTYDPVNDVFYAPQPYPSWSISAPTWLWTAPVPYPTDGNLYYWDEATLSWVEYIQ